jgi:hypothetical protein
LKESYKINTTQLNLESTTYQNFIDAIKSPATKTAYGISFRRYLNHIKKRSADDLLENTNPRYIESQIIDYIMSLRNSGVSYATIQFLVAPIFTFYQLNDVILNRKKVSRYLGEYKRVVKDLAYTTEQIQQTLQNVDSRTRMCILILSSTACRIGSLSGLTLGNLTKLPDYGLYKIVFYEGTNNEYYTFTTRECASTGIDNYLFYRQRCGEKIAFNESTNRWEPSDVPLLRKQFDANDILAVRNPQPMVNRSVREALETHLVRCGIREVEHLTAPSSPKRVRKPVSLSNGFRKRAISIFIQADLNYSIRERLVDHSGGLDDNYFRCSPDDALQEYLKAESLTIDPSLRLQNEIQTLRVEKNNWQALRQELDELKEMFKPKP